MSISERKCSSKMLKRNKIADAYGKKGNQSKLVEMFEKKKKAILAECNV